ncbi:hypothetical protein [Streptomyces sp. NBC_00467]|uniref:hypothetical protein n=1 Tax=Streptomyces sp. NBC_00467 TaxID=2975752 RepID=UPI003FA760D5
MDSRHVVIRTATAVRIRRAPCSAASRRLRRARVRPSGERHTEFVRLRTETGTRHTGTDPVATGVRLGRAVSPRRLRVGRFHCGAGAPSVATAACGVPVHRLGPATRGRAPGTERIAAEASWTPLQRSAPRHAPKERRRRRALCAHGKDVGKPARRWWQARPVRGTWWPGPAGKRGWCDSTRPRAVGSGVSCAHLRRVQRATVADVTPIPRQTPRASRPLFGAAPTITRCFLHFLDCPIESRPGDLELVGGEPRASGLELDGNTQAAPRCRRPVALCGLWGGRGPGSPRDPAVARIPVRRLVESLSGHWSHQGLKTSCELGISPSRSIQGLGKRQKEALLQRLAPRSARVDDARLAFVRICTHYCAGVGTARSQASLA